MGRIHPAVLMACLLLLAGCATPAADKSVTEGGPGGAEQPGSASQQPAEPVPPGIRYVCDAPSTSPCPISFGDQQRGRLPRTVVDPNRPDRRVVLHVADDPHLDREGSLVTPRIVLALSEDAGTTWETRHGPEMPSPRSHGPLYAGASPTAVGGFFDTDGTLTVFMWLVSDALVNLGPYWSTSDDLATWAPTVPASLGMPRSLLIADGAAWLHASLYEDHSTWVRLPGETRWDLAEPADGSDACLERSGTIQSSGRLLMLCSPGDDGLVVAQLEPSGGPGPTYHEDTRIGTAPCTPSIFRPLPDGRLFAQAECAGDPDKLISFAYPAWVIDPASNWTWQPVQGTATLPGLEKAGGYAALADAADPQGFVHIMAFAVVPDPAVPGAMKEIGVYQIYDPRKDEVVSTLTLSERPAALADEPTGAAYLPWGYTVFAQWYARGAPLAIAHLAVQGDDLVLAWTSPTGILVQPATLLRST